MKSIFRIAAVSIVSIWAAQGVAQEPTADLSAMRCLLHPKDSESTLPGSDSFRRITFLFEGTIPKLNLNHTRVVDPTNLLGDIPFSEFSERVVDGKQTYSFASKRGDRYEMLLMLTISEKGEWDAVFGDIDGKNIPLLGRCFYLTGPDSTKLYERDLQRAGGTQ